MREPHAAPEAVTPLPCLRILVVDDEPVVRKIIKDFLEMDGHAVETQGDPIKALERFRTGSWNFVILDRAMPGMDGLRLARAIKALDREMPIMLVSASPGWSQGSGSPPECYDAIVSKPFTGNDLRAGISRALRIHAVR